MTDKKTPKPELPKTVGRMTIVEVRGSSVSCRCSCGRSEQSYTATYYRKAAKSGADLRCRVCLSEELASKGPYRKREKFLSPLNSTLQRGLL